MKPKYSNPLLFVLRRFLAAPAIFISLAGFAHAADQVYQDANVLNTWNLTDANWDSGVVWENLNHAIFGGTGESVTVGTVTTSALTFNSAGYTLTGGTISLSEFGTPIDTTANVVINSVLASNGFLKGGTGTLTLGGVNTLSGPSEIAMGTVKLGNNAGLGAISSLTVDAGATLDLAGFTTARPIGISGTGVGGVGAIYNSAATAATIGEITFLGDATISNAATDTSKTLNTGTLTLAGYKLTIAGPGAVFTTMSNIDSGDIDINNGGTFYMTSGGALTNVTGTIKINTGGRLDTRDSNNTAVTSAHTIALNGGALINGGVTGNNGGGGGASLANNVTVDATNGGIISSISTGFGLPIRLYGSLSGSGPLSVTNNGIELRGNTANYTGTLTTTATKAVNFLPAATQSFPGIITGTGSIAKNGAGITTTLTGNNAYTGLTTVSAGTLVLTGNNGVTVGTPNTTTGLTGPTTVATTGTLKLDFSTNANRKIPSGLLTLSGGTIELAGGSYGDSVASTSLSAGTKSTITRSSGTSTLNLGAITQGTGSISFAQVGIAKTTNANNASGILGTWATVTGGILAANDGAGNIVAYTGYANVTRLSSGPQVITDAATSHVQITDGTGSTGTNITLGSTVTAINTLTQSSTGSVIIDPAGNTLVANTLITTAGAGSLTIGTGINNGILKSGGTALEIRDIAAAGITINSNIVDGTGASSLTKYEPGLLFLGGTNTYTGGTVINDGTLRLGSTGALPSVGTVNLAGASTILDLNGFNATIASLTGATAATVTDTSAGAGTVTLALTNAGSPPVKILNGTAKTLALRVTNANSNFTLINGSNTYSGGTVLANNATGTRMTVAAVTAGAYGTGPITVGEAATDKAMIYFSTATQTFANPIIANTALGTDRVGTIRAGAAALTLSGQLTANLAPFTFSNSTGEVSTITVSGRVTGPNGLTLLSSANSGTSLGLTLSNAANDYAGNTVINDVPQVGKTFTLTLGVANAIPNGIGKGNVVINTNGTGVGRLNLAGLSDTINGLSGNGTVDGVSGSPVLTIGDNNTTASFSGSIVNAAGNLALIKIGSGTQTLSGIDTYTGATTVSAGTLSLDYSTLNTSKLADAAALTLGNGTLNLENGTHAETVGSTTVSGKASITRGTGTSTINLNAITRTTGTLNLAVAGLATTDTLNTNGILGTWATIGGADWAMNSTNAADGSITAYTAYTDVNRQGGAIVTGATSNVRIIEAGSTGTVTVGAGTTDINSFLNSVTANSTTVTTTGILRLRTGAGIFNASNAGALTFTGGTLTAGTGANDTAGDLSLTNASLANDLTVASIIANNGTGVDTVSKYGAGRVILSGANTYTGVTNVNEGTLSVRSATGLGTVAGGVVVANGAGLEIDGNLTLGAEPLTLAGGTGALGFGALRSTSGTSSFSGTVTLNGDSTIGADAGTLTLSGVISGTGRAVTKVGAGAVVLTGTNTFTGVLTVSGGTVQVGAGGTAGSIAASSVALNGGTLAYNRSDSFTLGTQVTGTGSFLKAGVGTLTLDLSGGTSRIPATAALVMNNGTLNLSGGNFAQAVASTTITGYSTITRSTGTSTIALGAITRASGSLNIAGTGIATTTTANVNGILVGVTINGTLAMNDGAGNIVPFTGPYTDIDQMGGVVASAAGSNVRIVAGGVSGTVTTGAGTTDVGTLTSSSATGATNLAITGVLRVGANGTIVASSTIGGTFTISGGTLTAGGTDNTDGTLNLDNESTTFGMLISSAITNNGTGIVGVTKTGPGTVILAGANTATGTYAVNSGTLQIGNGGTTGIIGAAVPVVLNNTGILSFFRIDSAAVDLAGVISGTGSVTYQSSGAASVGSYAVNDASSYSGGTTINNARATVTNATAFGTGPVAVTSGGSAFFSSALTVANPFTIAGNGWNEGTTILGAIRTSAAVTFPGVLTLSANARIGTSSSATFSGTVSAPGYTIQLGHGAGSPTTLTGTVIFTTAAPITSSATTVDLQAGTFQYDNAGNTGNLFSTTTAGSLVKAASGTTVSLIQTEANAFGSARSYTLGSQLTLTGATLNLGATTGAQLQRLLGTTSVALSGSATIAQSQGSFSQYCVIEGAVTGSGTLALNRAATNGNVPSRYLNFKGNMSDYSGNVTVGTSTAAGTVIIGDATGWGSGTLTLTGAGSNVTVGDYAAINHNGAWTGGSALNFITGNFNPAGSITVGSGAALTVTNLATYAILFSPQGTFTVNGGTLSTLGTGGTSAFVPATGATWVFGGSAVSSVSAPVKLNNTGATFQVADAIAGAGVDTTISGIVSGSNGLTKTGAGTLSLTGANTYSGNTTVTAGTLSLATAFLNDFSTVTIATSGATLNLVTGTDVVDKLFFGGVQQASGIWGALGSGAAHEDARITGAGLLNVTSGAAADPYGAWTVGKGFTAGVNDGKGQNADNDGYNNLAEFAFDDAPLSGKASGKIVGKIAPVTVSTVTSNYYTLTLPVRATATTFATVGSDLKSNLGDGIYYFIQGSLGLTTFDQVPVEVTGAEATAIQTGLPGLTDAGWTYRTFRLPVTVAAQPKAFLRAKISE